MRRTDVSTLSKSRSARSEPARAEQLPGAPDHRDQLGPPLVAILTRGPITLEVLTVCLRLYQIEVDVGGSWDAVGNPATFEKCEARTHKLSLSYPGTVFRIVSVSDDPGADEYPQRSESAGKYVL